MHEPCSTVRGERARSQTRPQKRRSIRENRRHTGGMLSQAKRAAFGCLRAVMPNRVSDAVFVLRRYKRKFGTFPNVVRPTTFNEKVIWRMLFDRRPIWTRLQDKYALRGYVKERLGEDILPKLYWVTQDPSDIPLADLPRQFVVKPTHGSGWVRLVPDKVCLDAQELIATCRSWLAQNYYHVEREWAYKHIEPRIVVEEFVSDSTGKYPIDYKIYVFGGRARLIQIDTARFEDHRRDIYDVSWTKTGATSEYQNADRTLERPAHLQQMVACAEAIGDGLDFIRVDFYDTKDRLYLGELTTTPGGGMNTWGPVEFTRYMGGLWKLPYGVIMSGNARMGRAALPQVDATPRRGAPG